MLSFTTTRQDTATIALIVRRAMKHLKERDSSLHLTMDISACHANGCKLDLDRLLKADDFNFMHDIFGIRQHLNRKTGKLEDCFCPRFAK
jgi:hypothetical protein